MKYKIGDLVRVNDKEWYDKNKKESGDVVINARHAFTPEMSRYCGQFVVIAAVDDEMNGYFIMQDYMTWLWHDEMISGLSPNAN